MSSKWTFDHVAGKLINSKDINKKILGSKINNNRGIQSGRGFDTKQIINSLEKAIARDAKEVFEANQRLWLTIGIEDYSTLESLAKNKILSTGESYQKFRDIITTTTTTTTK